MFMKKAILALGLCALIAAPAPALAAEPVTLKFSHVNAENAWSTVNGLIPWLKKLRKIPAEPSKWSFTPIIP